MAMRSEVAFASGDVPGVTWITDVPWVVVSVRTLATFAVWDSRASSDLSAAVSAGDHSEHDGERAGYGQAVQEADPEHEDAEQRDAYRDAREQHSPAGGVDRCDRR